MIINVRGTSGSGKSTLVRRIMENYSGGTKLRIKEPGRKQPLGYLLTHPLMRKKLFVVGHYETPCGGCDTIPSMERIYEIVREADSLGHHVLFEGLLISAEVNRMQALHDEKRMCMVVHIDIPLEECLAGVNERRRRKKPDAPDVNPKNTASKHKGSKRAMERFIEGDVQVACCTSREDAYRVVAEALGLGS